MAISAIFPGKSNLLLRPGCLVTARDLHAHSILFGPILSRFFGKFIWMMGCDQVKHRPRIFPELEERTDSLRRLRQSGIVHIGHRALVPSSETAGHVAAISGAEKKMATENRKKLTAEKKRLVDARMEEISGPAVVLGLEGVPRNQINMENVVCRAVPVLNW